LKNEIVIVGIGQMGGLFGRGFLKTGHPVIPVLRVMSMEAVSAAIKDPALVLVAVAEEDLAQALEELPERWKNRVGLLQNELLPDDWREHGIENPTVIAVWFEKKFRSPITPLISSPIYGPKAELLGEALTALEVPVEILDHYDDLVHALVLKNLYILTANIAGLMGSDTVGGLLERDLDLTRSVFEDVLKLQEALTSESFNRDAIWEQLTEIFRAEPEHGSRGRSASKRLQRALQQADGQGLELSRLLEISRANHLQEH
jgi:hypothetical protein